VRIVERPEACRREVLNIGNPGNDVSIGELARALATAYAARVPGAAPATFVDVNAEVFYGPGYDDTHERIPDIDRARRLLDWTPRATLERMLPEIVDDYVTRYGAALEAERPTARVGGRR
jgi:UDP-apiose/xylose synthase